MKKIIFCSSVVFILFSCKKDIEDCNCGTIANDGISTNSDGTSCYWLEIRNSCTDNKKTFCFDQDVWMDANPGESFCVTNESGW
jgi:hypothetical protein